MHVEPTGKTQPFVCDFFGREGILSHLVDTNAVYELNDIASLRGIFPSLERASRVPVDVVGLDTC